MKFFKLLPILLCLGLGGWTHGNATNLFPLVFTGDNFAAVSAITGSLTASRTTCTAPCPITISASGVGATGATNAYQQGEFCANFADPSGTETITDAFSGQTVNFNNTQCLPEMTYMYRNAGTYVISVSVRYCSSGNCVTTPTYTTTILTQSIVVSTFTASGGTFFYASAGSGTTCSSGVPCPCTQFNSKQASNTQHNFNRGDTFSGTCNLAPKNGTVMRIGAFGSGTVPKIQITSGTNVPFDVEVSNGNSTSDIVASNIQFDVAGTAAPSNAVLFSSAGTTGTIQDVYLDNVVISNQLDIVLFIGWEIKTSGFGGTDTNQRHGCWLCSISGPLNSVNNRSGYLFGPYNWMFFKGCSVSGAGNDPTRDHHIYNHTQTHVDVSYCTFGNSDPTGTAPTRNYNVKMSWDPGIDGPSGFTYMQYYSVAHNAMTGTQRATNLGNSNNDSTISRAKNVVYSKNSKIGFTGEEDPFVGEEVAWRDEVICNLGTNAANPVIDFTPALGSTSFLKASVYRERIYSTSSQPVFNFNNINITTWTSPESFHENQVQGTTSAAKLFAGVFSQQASAGSFYGLNSWSCPSTASGACLIDNSTAKTLAQWQAAGLGATDNQTNPSFPNPTTCNLGARTP